MHRMLRLQLTAAILEELDHMAKDGLVSTKEIARALGVSARTVRRAVKDGKIPAVSPRQALRFDAVAVKIALSNTVKR